VPGLRRFSETINPVWHCRFPSVAVPATEAMILSRLTGTVRWLSACRCRPAACAASSEFPGELRLLPVHGQELGGGLEIRAYLEVRSAWPALLSLSGER